MLKRDEIRDPGSCLNKAHDSERVFVLIARDLAAPATIRFWCEERIRLGLNRLDDNQIDGARACASRMEHERTKGA